MLKYLERDIEVLCKIIKDETGRTKSGHDKHSKQSSANKMKTTIDHKFNKLFVSDASSLLSKYLQ